MPAPATTDANAAPSALADRAGLFRWLFPLLGVLSLLASCILWSLKKQLAGDETFTWVEIHSPSLAHLMRAAEHLGGAGMPLFYLTAWPWSRLFGITELSLRLYSSAGVCAAFLVIFFMLRRRFTARAAFLGTAFGLFASLIVIDQNVEARGYGLYLLLAAIAVAQALRIADTPRPRPGDLFLLALTQAGLVLGHVLAIVYAGLLLLALVLGDRAQHRFRPGVYLACVVGWLALIPWIPAILASMALGKPHTWIAMPDFADLVIGLSGWLFGGIYFPLLRHHPMGIVAGWALAMLCVILLVSGCVARIRWADSASEWSAELVGLILLLAPIALFVLSHLASPVYVGRYFIPSAIGIAILAAAWAQNSHLASGKGGVILAIVFLLLPIASAELAQPAHLEVAHIDRLAAGRPIVCDWLDDFLVVSRYSATPPEYPMDWQTALAGPPAATGAYLLVQNYQREGYLSGQPRSDAAILAQPAFVLLDNIQDNWFQRVIVPNPRLSWTLLAQLDPTRRLIAVQRK